MKIYISDQGDRGVGISSNEMTVDLNWDIDSDIKNSDYNVQDRDVLRKSFLEFAKDVLDFCNGRVDVVFGDECPDCLKVLVDDKCHNENCISYIKNEIEEKYEAKTN